MHYDHVDNIRRVLRDFGETSLRLAETFGKGVDPLNWTEKRCVNAATMVMISDAMDELKTLAISGNVEDFKMISENTLELMALRRELGF